MCWNLFDYIIQFLWLFACLTKKVADTCCNFSVLLCKILKGLFQCLSRTRPFQVRRDFLLDLWNIAFWIR